MALRYILELYHFYQQFTKLHSLFFVCCSFGGCKQDSKLLSVPLFSEPHHIPSHLISPLSLNDIPPRIAQTMENEESWEFDIISLEAATMKR